ncbi:MAG: hypothetical protein ACFB11_22040 [Paracoccaceae bacterium]
MRKAKRKPNSANVIHALSDLFIHRGMLAYIGCDNGLKFVAQAFRDWITTVGAGTAYI